MYCTILYVLYKTYSSAVRLMCIVLYRTVRTWVQEHFLGILVPSPSGYLIISHCTCTPRQYNSGRVRSQQHHSIILSFPTMYVNSSQARPAIWSTSLLDA